MTIMNREKRSKWNCLLPEALAAAKIFSARWGLDGEWEGNTFWGTKESVAKLAAFADGYLSCISKFNQEEIAASMRQRQENERRDDAGG